MTPQPRKLLFLIAIPLLFLAGCASNPSGDEKEKVFVHGEMESGVYMSSSHH